MKNNNYIAKILLSILIIAISVFMFVGTMQSIFGWNPYLWYDYIGGIVVNIYQIALFLYYLRIIWTKNNMLDGGWLFFYPYLKKRKLLSHITNPKKLKLRIFFISIPFIIFTLFTQVMIAIGYDYQLYLFLPMILFCVIGLCLYGENWICKETNDKT